MAELVPAEGPYLDAILDASHGLWHEGLTRRAYAQYYAAQRKTAWGRAHLERFALVDGGDVIASAKRYNLTMSLAGCAVRTAGIGAVFTQPAHRGRGQGRAIVERLLERSAADGFEQALLFSEIGAAYYSALGFDEIPTFDLTLRVAESARHGAPATLVRFADDRDLTHIAALGSVRAERHAFHLERDEALVQHAITKKRLLAGLGPPGAREVQFCIAEEGAMAVAYVVITASGGAAPVDRSAVSSEHGAASAERRSAVLSGPRWLIEECGDRDPTAARVGAILQTLIAREPSAKRPTIRGWLPPGFLPPQLTIVDRERSNEVMMIRGLRGDTPRVKAEDVLYWKNDVF